MYSAEEMKTQSVTLLGSFNPYPDSVNTDIWGYAASGREYAIMGVTGGTVFIDVTVPSSPLVVDFVSGPLAPPYEWRDIKTHSHYAYIVNDQTSSSVGMQIVDLSFLPDSVSLVNTYNATFTIAHNLFIADGYAYVVGATPQSGIHILDLSNPIDPVEVSYYSGNDYVHDVYVYNDTAYISAGNFTPLLNVFAVVDVTDKSNPQHISSSLSLPGTYAHSGWLTEDKRYFIACEELNTRDLTVWDLQDRSSWDLVVPSWQIQDNTPIHNVFVLGNYAHISYYKAGYVVLDISDPTNPILAGQYDTYPQSGGGFYNGAWGVYPYLPSGNVIVSDMATGLYICNFDSTAVNIEDHTIVISGFTLSQNYPNPFNPITNISYTLPAESQVKLSIYNPLGELVETIVNQKQDAGKYDAVWNAGNHPSGVYIYTFDAVSLSGSKQTKLSKKMLLLK